MAKGGTVLDITVGDCMELLRLLSEERNGGKLINGRKRPLICDNRGLVLLVMVTAANVTDRDAAKKLLFRLELTHPEVSIVWADSVYAGKLVGWAKTYLDITIKTVRRPPDAKGFVVLPRRWVVERSWSWIMRARRYCRDYERLPQVSESLITWAAVTLMTRRLTRRKARSAERRDVSPYCLAQAARALGHEASWSGLTTRTHQDRRRRTAFASAGTPGSATSPGTTRRHQGHLSHEVTRDDTASAPKRATGRAASTAARA